MKKRKLVLPIISLLVIVIISFIHSYGGNKSHGIKNSNALTIESSLEIVEENELLKEYIEDTKDFSTLSTNEVLKKIENNETFFLYFGRGTCPYCRDFVPELNKVSKEKNITINYLDTENIENDAQIQSLRERYDVEFVPTLIHLSDHGNNIKTFNAETDSLNEFFEDIRVNNEI